MKNNKSIIMFLTDECNWCKETKEMLDKHGKDYVMLDVKTNQIAKAISKKTCDGQEVCMILKGEVITKFDKKKLTDAILD
jgi:glutaredoxin